VARAHGTCGCLRRWPENATILARGYSLIPVDSAEDAYEPVVKLPDEGDGFDRWTGRPSRACVKCGSTGIEYRLSSHPFLCLNCPWNSESVVPHV
jgi:hypothetical protein